MKRTILTAPDGEWYCNYAGKIIASTVYLAEGADPSVWVLIDETEKQRLESEWYPEEVTDNVND